MTRPPPRGIDGEAMSSERAAARLHPLHRAWRMLPRDARRAMLRQGSAWLAPRPDPVPPAARAGVAVAVGGDQASGLGEAARLTLAALEALGIPAWTAGAAGPAPPQGVPLILHINPQTLPMELVRLG